MKRIAGVLLMLFGLSLGSWVLYDVFVDESEDALRRPGRAIGLAVAAMGVGLYWVRGERRAEEVPAEA